MEKLFVSYELAVMAKEKGFDEPVLACYDGRKEGNPLVQLGKSLDGFNYNQWNNRATSAPTHQQLIDFFRDEHNIYVNSDLLPNIKKYKGSFVPISITPKDFKTLKEYLQTREIYSTKENYDDYYEALNKALLEAFKLI
jgi:hypothetical protein